MAGLTSTGFEAKALPDIQNEINTALLAGVSTKLNLSSTSLIGQFVGIVAFKLRELWEAQQAGYAARDVRQATGDALEGLAALTGTTRRAATFSTVLVDVTLSATNSPYARGSLVVYPVGSPTHTFTNDATVTVSGTGNVLVEDVPFTCTISGAIRAPASSLTVIANPIPGFVSSTNPADATVGLEQETDAELRARQATEQARRGTGTVDAIRVDLVDALAATFVNVIENASDSTGVSDPVTGMPPHSIECIVSSAATNAEIAQAIFEAKPAGIQAYGSTNVNVTDSQGNVHVIGFTTPTIVDLYVGVTVKATAAFAGAAALRSALVDWAQANLGVGNDVLKARLESVCLQQTGVVDVAVTHIGTGAPGSTAANYVIGSRQIARLSTSTSPMRIVVTVETVTGAP